VVMVDDYHEMISTGWCNPTPWNTYREEPEESLFRRIDDMVKELKDVPNSIFALHAPPYDSDIDEAPELDKNMRPVDGGQKLIHVGSSAVRDAIMKYQPLLGLHGHIHEARGASMLGRTLCINPGSEYTEGILDGAIVELDKDKVKKWIRFSG
jgi:Icc-related predicted phosphoesterase